MAGWLCVASLAGCAASNGPSAAPSPLAAPSASDTAACKSIQTQNQARDEATIRRIEHDWLAAEMRGDASFLQCLLMPDYVNIDKAGHKHPGSDIIAHALNNVGKDREVPPIESTIVVNGDAATAYSLSKTRDKAGVWRDVHFIDSFLFRNGAWHSYTGVDL
ncbi:MAG: nuclear transport factor 2 family protein [Kofleriaceae bacterium]